MMVTKHPDDREIPIPVVHWVLAYVHVRLAGNPEEDIEDVVQNTLLGLVRAMKNWDSPIDAWTALAKRIADWRIADYKRARHPKLRTTSMNDDDADIEIADRDSDIDEWIENEWLRTSATQIKVALKEAAEGDPVDEELVAILLAKLDHGGSFPSFSAIGAEAGMPRQTACPRLAMIFSRAHQILRRRGMDA